MSSSFICPILGTRIHRVCELTPCGHYFDAAAILQIMVVNEQNNLAADTTTPFRCPLCRTQFAATQIYFSRGLQQLIDSSSDASTQTESSSLASCSVATQSEDPDVEDMDVDLPPITIFRGIHSFRTVNPLDIPINPLSSLDVPQSVIDNNKKFGNSVPIFKFVYQSALPARSLSIVLSDSGYLVYDLFIRGPVRDPPQVNNYVLYSSARKIDGCPVILNLLK